MSFSSVLFEDIRCVCGIPGHTLLSNEGVWMAKRFRIKLIMLSVLIWGWTAFYPLEAGELRSEKNSFDNQWR
jgi:hypothetical protein